MSLLLDALKRAEEAKKAQREAEAQSAAESGESLTLAPLEEEASAAAQSEPQAEAPLLTRNDLPNISQALEILPEDLAPPRTAGTPKRAQAKSTPARSAEDEEAFRNTARQLFEAKAPEYNPRKPFYITLGALGVFAIGIVIYFWYQLQPASTPARMASTPSVAAAVEAPREIARTAPTQALSSVPIVEPSRSTGADAPHTPTDTATRLADWEAPVLKNIEPQATASQSASEARDPAEPALHRVALKKSAPSGPSPAEQGYAAYSRGDFDAARTHYETALERDPFNRDALLGLAALDARQQDFLSAEARYLRLLEMDPRDPYAHAGLLSLRGQQDAVAAESRIKNLLSQRPDANVLHFTLGNQYAAQGRWPEAQQAYFKAYASEPTNPDYAFNLAVSLDHLRQPRLALEYYQKALKLAAERPASFQAAQAESRIVELDR